MYAPKEIIDFLESILGIYLSGIRHKERSAFILSDNDETNSNKMSKVIIKSKRFPNNNEIIIEVGSKNYWALLVREKTDLVNQCLDDILNMNDL